MTIRMTRRSLLKAGAIATSSLPMWPALAQERRFDPKVEGWRTFEVTTTVDVADTRSACKVWLPVPDINTDYQQSLDSTWSGNANTAKLVVDATSGVRMLYAEFADNVGAPTVSLTSRVRTRNRAVDWSRTGAPAEDPALLRAYLQPTELIPLDGIVRKTA
ncbi:MAG TPA: transglutaminase, partial [Burkholderiaceae bacterium]|nr:transglutaminase [Burkholderiaceae bacterium]